MTALIRNGQIVEATAAAVRAIQTAGVNTYTAQAPFKAIVAGQTLAFHANQTVLLAPALATALNNIGANLVLVP